MSKDKKTKEDLSELIASFKAKVVQINYDSDSRNARDYLKDTMSGISKFLGRLGIQYVVQITYNYTKEKIIISARDSLSDDAIEQYIESVRAWVENPVQRELEAYLYATSDTNELRRQVKSLEERLSQSTQNDQGEGYFRGGRYPIMFCPPFYNFR